MNEYVVLDDEDTFAPLSRNTTVVRFSEEDLDTEVEEGLTVAESLNNGDMKECINYATEELPINKLVDLYDYCVKNRDNLPVAVQKLIKGILAAQGLDVKE